MYYRRLFSPGGTYFFTVVTHHRKKIFVDEPIIDLLRGAILQVKSKRPFIIVAVVILPDHLHMIWTLPEGDSDYPTRWRLIKSFVSRGMVGQEVWQRRYWEHLIRDEADLERHVDYIHYNPVKHGYVQSPEDWHHSSYQRFITEGGYRKDWAGDGLELANLE
jgi:putative transposase